MEHANSDGELAMKAAHSLFYVEIIPRYLLSEESATKKKKYLQFTEEVRKSEVSRGIEPSPDSIQAGTEERYSTGFAVAENGNTLRILTCAHSVEDIFTSQISRSPADLNAVFRFDVHCIHHESHILGMRSSLIPSERKRDITPAWVVSVDTKLDLVVLEVDADELKRKKGCKVKHPAIKLATSDPSELSNVTLIGWPTQRCSSLATGRVSHCVWTYDAVSSLNNKGYMMKFLEVHGLVAANGFSGGLMINDAAEPECVALYHGVMNEMGYVVSREDLKSFLTKHKVMTFQKKAEKEGGDQTAAKKTRR